MLLNKLNESKTVLTEKRTFQSKDFKDVNFSNDTIALMKAGRWEEAFAQADINTSSGEVLYAIYVEFAPEQKDMSRFFNGNNVDYAKTASEGYLKLESGTSFDKSIKSFPIEGFLPVYGTTGSAPINNGKYRFVIEKDRAKASKFNREDAIWIVQAAKNTKGVKVADYEETDRREGGNYAATEQDAVVAAMISEVLFGKTAYKDGTTPADLSGLNTLKSYGYLDLLIGSVIQSDISVNNPILKFLIRCRVDITRSGFTILNNLYSGGELERKDLVGPNSRYDFLLLHGPNASNYLTGTLKWSEASEIFDVFEWVLDGYENLNAAAAKTIVGGQKLDLSKANDRLLLASCTVSKSPKDHTIANLNEIITRKDQLSAEDKSKKTTTSAVVKSSGSYVVNGNPVKRLRNGARKTAIQQGIERLKGSGLTDDEILSYVLYDLKR